MSCTNCLSTKSIPCCTTDLLIGTIDDVSTDVYIFVKNLTTGYTYRQESTSGAYGSVTLDMALPSPSFYNPNSIYELWVTLRDTTQNDQIDLSIGNETNACASIKFNAVYDDAGDNVDYLEHTLEAI